MSDLIFLSVTVTYISWSMILPCISDPFKWEVIILWIRVQSGTVNDPILFEGYCDLYFMATGQLFYPVFTK